MFKHYKIIREFCSHTGQQIKTDVDIERDIGEIDKGRVFLAFDNKLDILVVVKIIGTNLNNSVKVAYFKNEIKILKSIDHANIIKILDDYEDYAMIYYTTKYYNNGDLCKYLNKNLNCNIHLLKSFYKQLASAVNYLHQNNIAHRDIKMENIYLENNTIYLGDFGFATKFRNREVFKEELGSRPYLAPDIYFPRGYYPSRLDCWAMGVILYAFVTKSMPFYGKDICELNNKIMKMEYNPIIYDDIAQDLIKHLFVYHDKRYNSQQILNHQFVK